MTIDAMIPALGGSGAMLIVVYALKLLIDWLRTDRETKAQAHTTNASTAEVANAVILKSLEALEHENGRLRSRVVDLETELADSDARMDTLQVRLIDAQNKIQAISRELVEMKANREVN